MTDTGDGLLDGLGRPLGVLVSTAAGCRVVLFGGPPMMTSRELLAELSAAHDALSPAQRDWLAAQGVGKAACLAAGGVGVAPVVAFADGTFEPAGEDGGWAGDACAFNAVVMGVHGGSLAPTAACGLGDPAPEPYDEVAFDPRRPDRWWRRTRTAFALGEARLLAGEHGIDPAFGDEVRLCATPLSWLAALEAGGLWAAAPPVCPLGPVAGLTADCVGEATRFLRDVLAGAARIVCDDAAHAARVHKALRRAPKTALPEVFVAEAREAAA